jgi:hypothetical protein
MVENGHDSMRLKLNTIIYRAGSSSYDAQADEHWQGVCDALTHDVTYGGLTRSTTATNKFWQGASIGETFADWDTAITPTLDNFRKAVDAVSQYAKSDSDLIAITSPDNWRQLQSQAEVSRVYKEGPVHKHGFTSMFIDNIEVFKEPWLQSNANSNASTDKKKFFLLNLSDWYLMLDPEHKLGTITDWTWQAQMNGGADEWLSRVMLAGNLMCLKPNGSIYRSNMSM